MKDDTWLYQDNGDLRPWAQWLGLIVLIIGLTTGCAPSSTVLAKASNPSPVVMPSADVCLENARKSFAKDPSVKSPATAAAEYCNGHRDREVARDTTTADKAVKSEDARARAKEAEARRRNVGCYDPMFCGGIPIMSGGMIFGNPIGGVWNQMMPNSIPSGWGTTPYVLRNPRSRGLP